MQQEFYQIYHNHHPLLGQSFNNIQEARIALKEMYDLLYDYAPSFGYKIEKRTTFLRNILGVRRIYADGSEVLDTYIIQHLVLKPVISKF